MGVRMVNLQPVPRHNQTINKQPHERPQRNIGGHTRNTHIRTYVRTHGRERAAGMPPWVSHSHTCTHTYIRTCVYACVGGASPPVRVRTTHNAHTHIHVHTHMWKRTGGRNAAVGEPFPHAWQGMEENGRQECRGG